MSHHHTIEQHLQQSFSDYRLSQDEKHSLHSLLKSLSANDELLAFTRNQAFSLIRQQQLATNELIQALGWLERVIKVIDNIRIGIAVPNPEAFFSPGETCLNKLIKCLQDAHNSIDICVFTISDNRLSDAILAAHNKGCKVRVISDNYKSEDDGNDVRHLATQGVPVKLDVSRHHMHHKFAIFDDRLLVNGSFNWTLSASTKNQENITLLYEPALIDRFNTCFNALWNACRKV